MGIRWNDDDELPPTLGVREPKRPKPPTLSPGYALRDPRPTEESPSQDPRVTFVVAAR